MGPDPGRPIARTATRRKREHDISRHQSTGRRPRPTTGPKADSTGFEPFRLRSELLQALRDADFRSPRPIQTEAIPPALEGRDVLGLAQTGTGKTAAFALPILQRLLEAGPRTQRGQGRGARKGPRALVVAPTRELASQVHADFERLGAHTPIGSIAVFGGVPIARQIRGLKNHPDVVVACPGRLLDLHRQGALELGAVEVLVLDEADHMFDMGFLPDVRRIVKALPKRRQNLLFSATMPREIRKLADTVLHRPEVIELANARPAETIEHALLPLAEGDKTRTLEGLLREDDCTSAIVFLRTKRRAKRLAKSLADRGHPAVALQGNMSQPQRERALQGFRDGRFQVLVATDIAARGLDIAGVSHVINFDVPNTPDAYTHRIGRTGRAELTGKALTFVTPADAAAVRAIEKRLGEPIDRLAGPSRGGHRERKRPTGPRPTVPQHARGPKASARPRRDHAPTQAAALTRSPAPTPGPSFGSGVLDAPPRRRRRA